MDFNGEYISGKPVYTYQVPVKNPDLTKERLLPPLKAM